MTFRLQEPQRASAGLLVAREGVHSGGNSQGGAPRGVRGEVVRDRQHEDSLPQVCLCCPGRSKTERMRAFFARWRCERCSRWQPGEKRAHPRGVIYSRVMTRYAHGMANVWQIGAGALQSRTSMVTCTAATLPQPSSACISNWCNPMGRPCGVVLTKV